MEELPHSLRREIAYNINKKIFRQLSIFHDFPLGQQAAICGMMTPLQVCLPLSLTLSHLAIRRQMCYSCDIRSTCPCWSSVGGLSLGVLLLDTVILPVLSLPIEVISMEAPMDNNIPARSVHTRHDGTFAVTAAFCRASCNLCGSQPDQEPLCYLQLSPKTPRACIAAASRPGYLRG